MTGRDVIVHAGAATLFVVLFFVVWQPVRGLVAVHALAPLLTTLGSAPVEAAARPPSVYVAGGAGTPAYSVPGGLYFLVPGVLLVTVAPRQPYWMVLLGALLALGAVGLAAFIAGVAGHPAGYAVAAFLQSYVVPPVSLGLPLYLLTRAPRRSPSSRSSTNHIAQ